MIRTNTYTYGSGFVRRFHIFAPIILLLLETFSLQKNEFLHLVYNQAGAGTNMAAQQHWTDGRREQRRSLEGAGAGANICGSATLHRRKEGAEKEPGMNSVKSNFLRLVEI